MPLVRLTSIRVEARFDGVNWTSLHADMTAGERFTWRRGMGGGGPLDNVATTGTLEFGLKNFVEAGSVRPEGYYSPNHANVRGGWNFGLAVRVVGTYGGTDYVLWRGTVRSIEPVPGKYGQRTVRVQATDFMDDLANTEVRSVAPQIDQTEVQCLQAVIAAMPTDAQPPATSYDDALETFPYALDNVSGGVLGMTAVVDVIDSCQGTAFVQADGTFRYTNRHTRATAVSDFTFDETMLDRDGGIAVPSDLANVFNEVSAVAHPKTTAAAIVLCGITGAQYVGPGETIELFLDYTDPTTDDKLIGGTGFTDPLVENTDYDARANADGTGADLSANLTVTVDPFAASAKFTVTNNGAVGAYLVNGSGTPLLQLRGTGIYDNAPETRRSTSVQSYGVRRLDVDLKYQTSGAFASDAAVFIRSQYDDLDDQVEQIAYDPQKSDALMLEALTVEIGDVKTVSETMTGTDDVEVIVQAVEYEVTKGDYLHVRYVTAPVGPFKFWQLGIVGASELGVSTTLGF